MVVMACFVIQNTILEVKKNKYVSDGAGGSISGYESKESNYILEDLPLRENEEIIR